MGRLRPEGRGELVQSRTLSRGHDPAGHTCPEASRVCQDHPSVVWRLEGDPKILHRVHLQEMLVPGLQIQGQSWDGGRAQELRDRVSMWATQIPAQAQDTSSAGAVADAHRGWSRQLAGAAPQGRESGHQLIQAMPICTRGQRQGSLGSLPRGFQGRARGSRGTEERKMARRDRF